ncbi:cellobiohydrolase I-II [Coprinopsis sp. MPI-PUGE-AT-0042]|nr:cellobiohydrolase I-II [Coprinopsis sp. MPI-PUGE-AT-0042]
MMLILAALSLLPTLSLAQRAGNDIWETHPRLPWQTCTQSGCTTQTNGQIVLDADWRWIHQVGGFNLNCFVGNTWYTEQCTKSDSGFACAQACGVEGAGYKYTHGITTSGDTLTLKFVTKAEDTSVGSRVYLMESDSKYQMFHLLNKEFTFDVDVSRLPCGVKGSLYFVQMDADGGMSKYPTNKAGAKYGTGYCDSRCPKDVKFINGEVSVGHSVLKACPFIISQANCVGWIPSPTDAKSGVGKYGSCCTEMDIWEANSISAALTAHPYKTNNSGGQQRCTGQECGAPARYDGLCDRDGCDFNSFRMGANDFYGNGMNVDNSKPFTVVTQFITDTNSSEGTLTEIPRLYRQDGKIIQNSKVNFPGLLPPSNSITETYCTDQKAVFGDPNSFRKNGGLAGVGASLEKGHVLVLSISDDHADNMLWLDSNYPADDDPRKPGVARGTCSTSSGKPEDVENNAPDSQVVFSNIRFGDIGTTYS